MTTDSRPGGLLLRLYVPATTLALLCIANWGARGLVFDPLRAAQNPRLTIASAPQAAPDEPLEFSVVRPLFPPDSPHALLTTRMPKNSPHVLSILFAGNSQTIATMDEKPGDRYSPIWLWELLNRSGENQPERFALRIGSEPNLRMSELLVKAVLGTAMRERRCDVVVAGIVVDGLRWVDPRADIARLAQSPSVRPEIAALLPLAEDLPSAARVIRQTLGEGASSGGTPSGGNENARAGNAVQVYEDAIQARLDAALPLFQRRADLYGIVYTRYMDVRNRVLGVRTSTLRPIPDGMYSTNLQIIETMLRYLKSRGVHAVIYFAPIRPTTPNPTDPADAARFRRDLPPLCSKYGDVFLDCSNVVPEEMWTNYPDSGLTVWGQRDFAHFTGRAHRRLGEHLAADLRPYFERWLAEKGASSTAP
jgi:hypothetical protein